MLLPIVLLLATAGPIQQARTFQFPTQQTEQARTFQFPSQQTVQPRTLLIQAPAPNKFVHKLNNPEQWDSIAVPKREGESNGCFSITAYVFSDGENPQLQYVTHCPNADGPYINERAQGKGMRNDQQPELKRTKN